MNGIRFQSPTSLLRGTPGLDVRSRTRLLHFRTTSDQRPVSGPYDERRTCRHVVRHAQNDRRSRSTARDPRKLRAPGSAPNGRSTVAAWARPMPCVVRGQRFSGRLFSQRKTRVGRVIHPVVGRPSRTRITRAATFGACTVVRGCCGGGGEGKVERVRVARAKIVLLLPAGPSAPASACFRNGRCAIDANKTETHMHAIQRPAPPAANAFIRARFAIFFSNTIPAPLTARLYSNFFFFFLREQENSLPPISADTFCCTPMRGKSSQMFNTSRVKPFGEHRNVRRKKYVHSDDPVPSTRVNALTGPRHHRQPPTDNANCIYSERCT